MEEVRNFYNKTPFPNFELERFNSKEDLRILAHPFAGILDRSIPKDASVIDIGTGTGQLSALLSLRRNCVYGVDFSEGSLKKARALKKKLDLDSWHLKQTDITDINQIQDIGLKFDYVLCLGVLHHTKDPYQSFKNILKLLNPKGYICIGLYHKFARIPLKIRRTLTKTVFRDNKKIKDWFIKMQIGDLKDKNRANGWWNDQYLHPHESTHTLGEVLRWFKKNNIEYYQTEPPSMPFDKSNLVIGGLWNKTSNLYPYFPIRFYKQFFWLWKTHAEGGYWITCGRQR